MPQIAEFWHSLEEMASEQQVRLFARINRVLQQLAAEVDDTVGGLLSLRLEAVPLRLELPAQETMHSSLQALITKGEELSSRPCSANLLVTIVPGTENAGGAWTKGAPAQPALSGACWWWASCLVHGYTSLVTHARAVLPSLAPQVPVGDEAWSGSCWRRSFRCRVQRGLNVAGAA